MGSKNENEIGYGIFSNVYQCSVKDKRNLISFVTVNHEDVVVGLRYCQAKSGGLHFSLAFSAAGSNFCQTKVRKKSIFSTFYVQLKFLRVCALGMSITIYGNLDFTM